MDRVDLINPGRETGLGLKLTTWIGSCNGGKSCLVAYLRAGLNTLSLANTLRMGMDANGSYCYWSSRPRPSPAPKAWRRKWWAPRIQGPAPPIKKWGNSGNRVFSRPQARKWSTWRQFDKQTSQAWRRGLPLISPFDHADKASAGPPIG